MDGHLMLVITEFDCNWIPNMFVITEFECIQTTLEITEFGCIQMMEFDCIQMEVKTSRSQFFRPGPEFAALIKNTEHEKNTETEIYDLLKSGYFFISKALNNIF